MNHRKHLAAIFAVCFSWAGLSWAGTYELDVAHTKILFKVGHLGISTVTGQFKDFTGSFTLDPDNLTTLQGSVTIQTASIDTENTERDEHLRSPDFFDAEKYPESRFVITKVENVGEGKLEVHGELTLHGVTKPVVLNAKFGGALKDPWGNHRAAFTATTTINRKDFGVIWNKVLDNGGFLVGEEVEIMIEAEGIGKKATD